MADKDAGWGAGVSSGPAAFGHEFHETLVVRRALIAQARMKRRVRGQSAASREPSPPATTSVSTADGRPNGPPCIDAPDELVTSPGSAAMTRRLKLPGL